MEKRAYRHGDVILVPVKKALGDEQKVEKVVLALGEVTGHSHQISKGASSLFKYNEQTYLKVRSKIATLSHEEHKALQLPQGDYEVIIQRDYEPDGWKKVQD